MRILLIILLSFIGYGCGKLEIGRELDLGREDKCENSLYFDFVYSPSELLTFVRSQCYGDKTHSIDQNRDYSNVNVTAQSRGYLVLANKNNNDCYLVSGSSTCFDLSNFKDISSTAILNHDINNLIIVSTRFKGVQVIPTQPDGWMDIDWDSIQSVMQYDGTDLNILEYPDFKVMSHN